MRAAFRLLRKQPRERLMICAENEAAAELHFEVQHGEDDGVALALESRIVLLGRRKLLRKEENGTLDAIIGALHKHCTDCDIWRVSVNNQLLGKVGVDELNAGDESFL